MDLMSSYFVKTYINQGLDYYYLTHASPCINVIATPLMGDSRLDISMVDFGPVLMMKRINHGAAIEEYRFPAHVMGVQLPTSNEASIQAFQQSPGGQCHSPFLTSGAKAQWVVPDNVAFYQLHIDARWLRKLLGESAMRDYLELSLAPSRKAYDASTLLAVASACEQALKIGLKAYEQHQALSADDIADLFKQILLPCLNSELTELKPSPRQKILGKALDYIHKHYASPISLTTLADVTATSVRNLQLVFKHELGISPGSYIQQFRLHRFRHMLAMAASVTEAAYASGFKHLGRLTERYAQVFDHKPSSQLSSNPPEPLQLGDPFEIDWQAS